MFKDRITGVIGYVDYNYKRMCEEEEYAIETERIPGLNLDEEGRRIGPTYILH
jgi:hypothetical protein